MRKIANILLVSCTIVILIYVSVIYFVQSSLSNQVCFDADNLTIVSQNGKLTSVLISKDNSGLNLFSHNINSAKTEIVLIQKKYPGYEVNKFGNIFDQFSLYPNSTYIIQNSSIGGMDSFTMKFTTDSSGEVKFNSHPCK